MRSYLKGLPLGSYSVVRGVPGPVTMAGAAISVDISASDPVPSTRKKPSSDQLIWSGTSYSKYYNEYRHTPLEYEMDQSSKRDWSTFTHYWKSSSTVCGSSGAEAVVPVDPMNKLLGKLRDDVANFATTLGEYRDTAALVTDVGTKILKSVKLAKSGNIVGALKSLGSVVPTRVTRRARANRPGAKTAAPAMVGIDYPAAWLQYKLALSPMLDDINSSVGLLTGALQRSVNAITRVSTSRRTWLHSHKEVSRNRWTTVSSERTRQLIAYVVIDNVQLKAASDHGLTNPLGLLWELTWLSFVVDYVFNVSEWLQAIDQPYYFSRSICYETQRHRKKVESYAVGDAGLGSGDFKNIRLFGTPRSTYKFTETSRIVRDLSAVTPRWNPSGGFSRLVTLSALAVSIGRK